jgi:beta-glucosidase
MNKNDLIKNKLPKRTEEEINKLVDDLLLKMTLDEKIGQLYESGHDTGAVSGPSFDGSQTVNNIKKGLVGSILGVGDPEVIYSLQKVAVEESRLKIPLMFCNDIIHGCVTSFPINLALSCSFEPELIQKVSEVAAYESSHNGINVTFSPMVDLVKDPRWGRVMESNGEDTFLSSALGKAYVKGYQGNDMSDYDTIGSCAKHYIGYGAAIAGREYNTVELSRRTLHEHYLKPFKSCFDNGCEMVMSSFNTFEDVPATANKYLLKDVLRNELNFKGVVISDYTSSEEIINHKIARNNKEVAYKCINAGLDHEMISTSYINHLKELVLENKVDVELINSACKRVLRYKYLLGLFDNPYKNLYENNEQYFLTDNALEVAYEAASKSVVMLENKNAILPLNKNEKIALIGPYAKTKKLIGAWGGLGRIESCVSIYESLENNNIEFSYHKGCNINDNDKTLFEETINVCKNNDTIVLCLGEEEDMSGEGASRTILNLPGVQEDLLNELQKLNKKIVLLVFAGRPLILSNIKEKVDALLYCWFLGTKTGDALVDILYGKVNPSGKITMSFPHNVGQIPVYYNQFNTGRPIDLSDPKFRYRSHYIDCDNTPLYSFGYGLSYSKLKYQNLKYSSLTLDDKNNKIDLSIEIINDSDFDCDEIVQLYINCHYFSVSRPNLELKGFKKVNIQKHSSKTVEFTVTKDTLKYLNIDMVSDCEETSYDIYISTNSVDLNNKITIEVK